jgi:hypothetical protein
MHQSHEYLSVSLSLTKEKDGVVIGGEGVCLGLGLVNFGNLKLIQMERILRGALELESFMDNVEATIAHLSKLSGN